MAMNKPMLQAGALLAFALGGLAFIVVIVSREPSEQTRWVGWTLLVIGLFNVLIHKKTGSDTYRWAMKLNGKLGMSDWIALGERNVQVFYLVLGMLIVLAGVALLIRH